MIHYENRCGFSYVFKIFQRRGSVFPKSVSVAIPSALIAVLLKTLIDEAVLDKFFSEEQYLVLNNSGAWSGFSFLVGFLIVFRTSQSYSRFWDGSVHTYSMHAEWFDACSNLVAFCAHSKADRACTDDFKHLIIRMFSLLHVLALAEIEDSCKDDIQQVNAFRMELIDVHGIDPFTLQRIKESDSKVELVFTWVQQLIVAHLSTGVMSIPPPILSRVFQELSNGMVAFDQAMKITLIPFPFPYAQTCDCLMMIHWLVSPFVIAQWATHPFWAGCLTFIQVFILWSLNFIAVELENPFGNDDNDLDGFHLQMAFNRHLSMLINPCEDTLPKLLPTALKDTGEIMSKRTRETSNLASAWLGVGALHAPARSAKRRDAPSGVGKVVRRLVSREQATVKKEGNDQSSVKLLRDAGCYSGHDPTLQPQLGSRGQADSGVGSPVSIQSPLAAPSNRTKQSVLMQALPVDACPAPFSSAVQEGSKRNQATDALANQARTRGVSPPPLGYDSTNLSPTVFGAGSSTQNCTKSPAPVNCSSIAPEETRIVGAGRPPSS